jgi:sulfoacetaldehyde dehydrogenase
MTAVLPEDEVIAATVLRARSAAEKVEHWTQRRVDTMIAAVGWHCYREDNAQAMSQFAYQSTGLGDAAEMFSLHRRRVLGTLRDLHGVTTTGVVDAHPARGTIRLAKPVGVVAATCPTTAPCSTAVCIALPVLKTRNALILIPSPRGSDAVSMAVAALREGLENAGAPADLVQCSLTQTKESAMALMRSADLVMATGGDRALRRAYSTGTPAIGAGVGNATVIVDETADIQDAARKIAVGACLNNGTSCSSESNVLVHESIELPFRAELHRNGVHVCGPAEVSRLRSLLWPDHARMDRRVVGRPAQRLAADLNIDLGGRTITSLAVPLLAVDLSDPLFGEKLSPVFALVRYQHFGQAISNVQDILDRSGRGHSCGIHTRTEDRAMELASQIRCARVLVNQSIAIGNSGSFDNGLPFSPTVACGTWGGCAHSENITWRNFLNYTTISRTIPPVPPDEEVIFAALRQAESR